MTIPITPASPPELCPDCQLSQYSSAITGLDAFLCCFAQGGNMVARLHCAERTITRLRIELSKAQGEHAIEIANLNRQLGELQGELLGLPSGTNHFRPHELELVATVHPIAGGRDPVTGYCSLHNKLEPCVYCIAAAAYDDTAESLARTEPLTTMPKDSNDDGCAHGLILPGGRCAGCGKPFAPEAQELAEAQADRDGWRRVAERLVNTPELSAIAATLPALWDELLALRAKAGR